MIACGLAPDPHRPVKPRHRLLDVLTRGFSGFHGSRLFRRFYVEEFGPHKHEPPTYFMKRILNCRVDPRLLVSESAERNVCRSTA